jgi:hypothetical protein
MKSAQQEQTVITTAVVTPTPALQAVKAAADYVAGAGRVCAPAYFQNFYW